MTVMTVDETVHGFFRAVDRRDWSTVGATLAEQVATDYTSLFGGEPEQVSGDELVSRWRSMLPGFDATQHLLGPLVVSDDTAECNVRGYHHLRDQTWMVAGWYELGVAPSESGWRIDRIILTTSYQTGDADLVQRAQARVAAKG